MSPPGLAYISYHPLVHVDIGPLRVSPHGIGIAVGFLLGARVMLPAAEKRGITADDVSALLVRVAIGAIVGARLAYVLNHIGDYTHDPLEIIKIWHGGISLLGGFAGAIAWALPEMRKRKLSFWQVMDAAAPGMAVGVIIGRIGDLIVWDHLGKATHFFLGYKCPPLTVATAVPCIAGPGGAVHEPALYDFFLTILVLLVLLWLRRTPRYDGFLITVFGVFYGFNRFLEDWFRVDVTHGTGLTGSQWTAVVTMLVCAAWLIFGRRTPGWGRWNESVGSSTSVPPDPVNEE